MKTLAIALPIGLAITLLSIDMPVSDPVGISDHQTVIVTGSKPSFERGSYSILRPDYDRSTILSNEELIDILRLAGFEGNGLRMAWAIVFKESTNRPMAHNDNHSTGDNSYGLFQINMKGSLGPDRRDRYGLSSNEDLFNPIVNSQVAFKISKGGKDWSAWTTYKKAKSIINQFPG